MQVLNVLTGANNLSYIGENLTLLKSFFLGGGDNELEVMYLLVSILPIYIATHKPTSRLSFITYQTSRWSFMAYQNSWWSFMFYQGSRWSFMSYQASRWSLMSYQNSRWSFMSYQNSRWSFMSYQTSRWSFMFYQVLNAKFRILGPVVPDPKSRTCSSGSRVI